MKRKFYLLFGLFVLLTTSCDNEVDLMFEEPESPSLPYSFITVNDVPCAADTVSQTLYCPVSPLISINKEDIKVKVSPVSKSCQVYLDNCLVKGDSISISHAFEREHDLYIVGKDSASCWKVAFTTLPVVELSTNSNEPIGKKVQKGTFELIDPERRTDAKSYRTCDESYLRVRGGTSRQYQKKSYAVTLIDEEGEEIDVPVMGIRKHHNWILDAMAVDKSRMRNRVIFDVWNNYSHLPYDKSMRNGTVGHYVEVICNRRYLGLYVLSDKVNRDLLELKSSKEKEEKVRGVIYKSYIGTPTTTMVSYENKPTKVSVWEGWKISYPDFRDSERLWDPLVNLIDFVKDDSEEGILDFRTHYQEYFYEENLLDYMTLLMAFNLRDNLAKNLYLSIRYFNLDERFLLTPWDLDVSFGGDWKGNISEEECVPEHLLHGLSIYKRLWDHNVDGYCKKQQENWNRNRAGALEESNVFRYLTDYATLLKQSGAWRREYERWNGVDFDLEVSVDPVVKYMQDWYRRNVHFLDGWFNNMVKVVNP